MTVNKEDVSPSGVVAEELGPHELATYFRTPAITTEEAGKEIAQQWDMTKKCEPDCPAPQVCVANATAKRELLISLISGGATERQQHMAAEWILALTPISRGVSHLASVMGEDNEEKAIIQAITVFRMGKLVSQKLVEKLEESGALPRPTAH